MFAPPLAPSVPPSLWSCPTFQDLRPAIHAIKATIGATTTPTAQDPHGTSADGCEVIEVSARRKTENFGQRETEGARRTVKKIKLIEVKLASL